MDVKWRVLQNKGEVKVKFALGKAMKAQRRVEI
jgi:hypothetical protein